MFIAAIFIDLAPFPPPYSPLPLQGGRAAEAACEGDCDAGTAAVSATGGRVQPEQEQEDRKRPRKAGVEEGKYLARN